MSSRNRASVYEIPELADPSFPKYQAIACGDVDSAIATGSEHLLRTLAHMEPGSCSGELRFVFRPEDHDRDKQSRLGLFLRMCASEASVAQNLDRLVRSGPLSRFYRFERIESLPQAEEVLPASLAVVRRQDFVKPLYTCEFNHRIPDRYYTIDQFKPNKRNDYMMLDRVLDRIDEPVTISIRVQPADISAQLHAHAGYLALLAAINHGWDTDNDDFTSTGYTGSDGPRYVGLRNPVRPLTYKDQLANEIFWAQSKIHKTLHQPHLLFSIRIAAKTKGVARLVTSTLAESAFKEGSYRIIDSDENGVPFDGASGCSPQAATTPPLREHASEGEGLHDYDDLKCLSRLATVDELRCAFQLPIARFSRPLCCRKNTDPQRVAPKDLIVIGHDEQSLADDGSAIARGISEDVLRKHLSLFELPGSGKTTGNTNVLYQLDERLIPFLVFECAKKEYRVLKRFKRHKVARFRSLAQKLRVYTPGAKDLYDSIHKRQLRHTK